MLFHFDNVLIRLMLLLLHQNIFYHKWTTRTQQVISNTLLSRVIFFTFRNLLGNCKSVTKACKERLRKLVENFQNFGRSKCGTHSIKVHKFNFSISFVSVLLLVYLSLTNQKTAKQRYQERLTNTLGPFILGKIRRVLHKMRLK